MSCSLSILPGLGCARANGAHDWRQELINSVPGERDAVLVDPPGWQQAVNADYHAKRYVAAVELTRAIAKWGGDGLVWPLLANLRRLSKFLVTFRECWFAIDIRFVPT